MSTSHVVVYYNARGYKVSCTPSKSIYDILKESTERAGVSSDNFGLRVQGAKSPLDLSLTYRLAHLPPGAKLDLIQIQDTGSIVNVALDVAGVQGRKTAKFPASTTVWDILGAFDSPDVSLLNRMYHAKKKGLGKGPLMREQPVVLLLNRELVTDEQLQTTTLASLGVRQGSVAIKVSFKQAQPGAQTGSPTISSQAAPPLARLVEAPPTQAPAAPVPAAKVPPAESTGPVPPAESVASNSPSSAPSAMLSAAENPSAATTELVRDIQVVVPGSSASAVTRNASDDEPRGMSVDQAKAYHASLRQASRGTVRANGELLDSEAPLMTAAQRDAALQKRRDARKPQACRIKFRFPDGVQASGTFSPDEPATALYTFCTQLLVDGSATATSFELRMPGNSIAGVPKSAMKGSAADIGIPNDPTKLLWKHLDLASATLLQVIPVPRDLKLRVKDEYRASASVAAPTQQTSEPAQMSETSHEKPSVGDKLAKKTPKWLKKTLGKK
ncbi:hypothetical protein PYCC9005_001993 [Savitreella phatthalungensis]